MKGNYSQLRLFMDRNWIKEFEHNVDNVWNYFRSELEREMKPYIPLCKGNSWKRKSAWSRPISALQKEMINKKCRLWHRYQETRDIKRLQEYKKVRNCVRKESRKLEKRTITGCVSKIVGGTHRQRLGHRFGVGDRSTP